MPIDVYRDGKYPVLAPSNLMRKGASVAFEGYFQKWFLPKLYKFGLVASAGV